MTIRAVDSVVARSAPSSRDVASASAWPTRISQGSSRPCDDDGRGDQQPGIEPAPTTGRHEELGQQDHKHCHACGHDEGDERWSARAVAVAIVELDGGILVDRRRRRQDLRPHQLRGPAQVSGADEELEPAVGARRFDQVGVDEEVAAKPLGGGLRLGSEVRTGNGGQPFTGPA